MPIEEGNSKEVEQEKPAPIRGTITMGDNNSPMYKWLKYIQEHSDWTIRVPLANNGFGANDIEELYGKVCSKFALSILRIDIMKTEKAIEVKFPRVGVIQRGMERIIYGAMHPASDMTPYDVVVQASQHIMTRLGWNITAKDVKNVPNYVIYYLESEWDYISNQYVYENLGKLEEFFNKTPNGEPNGKLPLYKMRYVTRAEIVNPPAFFNDIDVERQPVMDFVGDDTAEQRFVEGENEVKTKGFKNSFMCVNLKYEKEDRALTDFLCYEFEGRMDDEEREGRLRIFRNALYEFNNKYRKED